MYIVRKRGKVMLAFLGACGASIGMLGALIGLGYGLNKIFDAAK